MRLPGEFVMRLAEIKRNAVTEKFFRIVVMFAKEALILVLETMEHLTSFPALT